jgi:hypothetical protein
MVGQILPNNNESVTEIFPKIFWNLNKALWFQSSNIIQTRFLKEKKRTYKLAAQIQHFQTLSLQISQNLKEIKKNGPSYTGQ